IQDVVTGELDCSFANTISTVIAQTRGMPVTMVALTSALGKGSQVILVKDDSPIKSPEDLDGKTIGVNSTDNIGDILTYTRLNELGFGDIKPDFVEVPFPEMIDGVKGGSLDSIYLAEPFRTAGLNAGLRE